MIFALSFSTPAWTMTIDEVFENAVKVDPSLRSSRFNQLATAENIAIHLLYEICPKIFANHQVECVAIKLYETPNCFVYVEKK